MPSNCKDCSKEFASPQSLCNHRKRKHPDTKNPEEQKYSIPYLDDLINQINTKADPTSVSLQKKKVLLPVSKPVKKIQKTDLESVSRSHPEKNVQVSSKPAVY